MPDRLYQLIFADDPITVSHEVNDQIEYLRLDMDDLARLAQFMPVGINFKMSEAIFHDEPPHRLISTETKRIPNENKCFSKRFRKALPEAKVYRSAIDTSMDNPPNGQASEYYRYESSGPKRRIACSFAWKEV